MSSVAGVRLPAATARSRKGSLRDTPLKDAILAILTSARSAFRERQTSRIAAAFGGYRHAVWLSSSSDYALQACLPVFVRRPADRARVVLAALAAKKKKKKTQYSEVSAQATGAEPMSLVGSSPAESEMLAALNADASGGQGASVPVDEASPFSHVPHSAASISMSSPVLGKLLLESHLYNGSVEPEVGNSADLGKHSMAMILLGRPQHSDIKERRLNQVQRVRGSPSYLADRSIGLPFSVMAELLHVSASHATAELASFASRQSGHEQARLLLPTTSPRAHTSR